MLEVQASLQFAAHDAADHENTQKAVKKQKQQAVVAGATLAKRKAPQLPTKREYLNSTKTNRQREIVMQSVLKSAAPSTLESLAAQEREAATKHRSEMRSRRNNVVALRRSMTKRGKS
jgi:putative transposase